jgi:hypothetical protein
LNGWAFVWQSRPHWARAAGLQYDSVLSTSATAFAPDSLVRPDCSWSDFERKLSGAAVANETTDESAFAPTSVLGTVIRPEHTSVRMKVLRALQIRRPIARVNDSDVRGYNRLEPGWIAARISSLVAAVEIASILAGVDSVVRRARMVLESSNDGKRLVRECHAGAIALRRACQQKQ